jgi:hypothetical protein
MLIWICKWGKCNGFVSLKLYGEQRWSITRTRAQNCCQEFQWAVDHPSCHFEYTKMNLITTDSAGTAWCLQQHGRTLDTETRRWRHQPMLVPGVFAKKKARTWCSFFELSYGTSIRFWNLCRHSSWNEDSSIVILGELSDHCMNFFRPVAWISK